MLRLVFTFWQDIYHISTMISSYSSDKDRRLTRQGIESLIALEYIDKHGYS